MSSNVLRCCVANICEEHLFSMRFRSLRMKLSLDLVRIADCWWTNRGFLAGFFVEFKRVVAILAYGDFEIE